MKKIIYFSAICFTIVTMVSCGGAETTDKDAPVVAPGEAKKCIYSYNNDSTIIKWTAYKLTERAGVDGSFKSFTVTGTSENEDATKVLSGAEFSIETQSTETNDTLRNGKIFRYFFQIMNTETITGKVERISEDGSMATISIKMNGIEKDIEAPLKWDGEIVTVKTDINIEDWNTQDAMKRLNKECKEKHTGTDGITKVWPDVTIVIRTILTKNCPQ